MRPDQVLYPPPAPRPLRIRPRLADSLLTGWAAVGLTASLRLIKHDLETGALLFFFLGFAFLLFIGTADAWRSAELFACRTFRQRLPLILVSWLGPVAVIGGPCLIGFGLHFLGEDRVAGGLALLAAGLAALAIAVRMLVVSHRASVLLRERQPAREKTKVSWADIVVLGVIVAVIFGNYLWPVIVALLIAGSIVAGIVGGAFALRHLAQTFTRSRLRLRDWLAAVWLAGGWTALARLAVGPDMERFGWILVSIGLGSFLGSVWGWAAAERLPGAPDRSRPWLSLLGSAGAVFLLGAAILIYQNGAHDYRWRPWPGLNVLLGLLAPLGAGALVLVELRAAGRLARLAAGRRPLAKAGRARISGREAHDGNGDNEPAVET